MILETDNSPNELEVEMLLSHLAAYNRSHLKNLKRSPIAVWYKNEEGKLLGGVSGNTFGIWLEIKYLWVDEPERQKGAGTALLEQIEKAAIARKCQYAFVDTYDFQAKPFYLKNRYNEIFSLNEYPISGKRHYFTKNLC